MKLFLDDIRNVKDIYPNADLTEWIVVRAYEEFVNHVLHNDMPTLFSMDHDLADTHYNSEVKEHKEKTGLDCARWLIDYCYFKSLKLPKYKVHSFNPVGAQNIKNAFQDFEKFTTPDKI